MTASRLTVVFCDAPGCGDSRDEGMAPSAAEARAVLAEYGWQVAAIDEHGHPRADYCPTHRKDAP